MESPPSDDGFELVEKGSYDDDPAVYTDDEYEFVEAPVKRHSAPPIDAAAGVDQASPPPTPSPEAIIDHHHAKTIVPSTPPQGDVMRSPSPSPPQGEVMRSPSPPPQKAHAKEEEKMESPFSFYDAAPAAAPALPYDQVDMRGVAKLNVAAAPPRCWAPAPQRCWAPPAHGAYLEVPEQEEEEEEDDDEDYGYQYASCYDYADFGRARRVKRSSGRRGRTKKEATKGRPRGEERSSHIAGNY